MRDPSTWKDLLSIEPEFEAFEAAVLCGHLVDYTQISPRLFACHAWDLLPGERLFALLKPFLRQAVTRARTAMPALYASRLAGIDPQAIQSPQDWQQVPVLVKDDDATLGLRGFRSQASDQPDILRPLDFPGATMAFGSGGSQGRNTPTFLSLQDRDREVQGWRRGHAYHGLVPGDRALYTYNTTHKGGQWMQESLWQHGVEVHLRRPEETPLAVLDNLRRFGVNVLFTVQQPYQAMQRQAKAAGVNLHALVEASLENPQYNGLLVPDDAGRKQVQFIFLGGFEIVPYAVDLAREYLGDTPLATLLGSSEAIPQACSTNPGLTPTGLCHHNHLHLLPGPHYIEVLKYESGSWLPVEKGETGLLVYTSWARDGTIWLRYAPGDAATLYLDEGECPCGLVSPVISAVHRKDLKERDSLLLEGCAAG